MRTMDAAEGSIVVEARVADVYQRWLGFEAFPGFITVIKNVRKVDENRFVALLEIDGNQHEVILEMMLRVPQRRIAWRSLANHGAPEHLAAGVVSFTSISEQSTRINFKLTSSFGGAIANRVDECLNNFKLLLEEEHRKASN